MISIHTLDLGSLVVGSVQMPVYAFAIVGDHAVTVFDTGLGGPRHLWRQWDAVDRPMVDALADHSLRPHDVDTVINSHLHMDHCGSNQLFAHARFVVQRAELERARVESPELSSCFDFPAVCFALADGDVQVTPAVRVVATPGHTIGHQSVVVTREDGRRELLLGDAAYRHTTWLHPDDAPLLPGQAADAVEWRTSLDALRSLDVSCVRFSHDDALVTERPTQLQA